MQNIISFFQFVTLMSAALFVLWLLDTALTCMDGPRCEKCGKKFVLKKTRELGPRIIVAFGESNSDHACHEITYHCLNPQCKHTWTYRR